jgi:hypothetical protein
LPQHRVIGKQERIARLPSRRMTSACARFKAPRVHGFRAFLNEHLFAAAALIALALAMRMLVPTGFMPTADHDRIVVALCSGSGPAHVTIELGKDRGDPSPDAQAETPCAFAGLGSAALGGADPILLTIAVAFAMLLVARAVVPLAAVPLRLRPPLRGPPIFA